jgi:chromosome segregation ATPase
MRKELEAFPEIKRSLKARVDEEGRLARVIDEVRSRIETVRRSDEEYTRTFRLLDDGRRQDAKRLTDMQGELAAIRKRVDDQRGKLELDASTIKKLDTRVNELAVVENERREALNNFLENQALREVERERVWKEWQARFESIQGQTSDVESNLQTLDATYRSIKRTQQIVDEIAQKVERRINEITEIQRLSEERFRQEWVTFKADDQKRWTNYTLTLEEQRGDSIRQYERLTERVTHLDDEIQEIQDMLAQMSEQTEKRLQSLLATAHEWVSAFERSVGRTR